MHSGYKVTVKINVYVQQMRKQSFYFLFIVYVCDSIVTERWAAPFHSAHCMNKTNNRKHIFLGLNLALCLSFCIIYIIVVMISLSSTTILCYSL